jgi:hypothetical protein
LIWGHVGHARIIAWRLGVVDEIDAATASGADRVQEFQRVVLDGLSRVR